MAYQYALYEKKGRIAYITINRPEVMNALHPPANAELHEIFCDFRDDPEVWIAIMTGAGNRAFSAGNDLKYQAAGFAGEARPQTQGRSAPFGGMTSRLDCYKPIIAAVNGYALAGGFEVVLACDIIVAVENAKFGLPEPLWGHVALAGGVHRLPRQIPYHVAMGMLLTGKSISAQEAYRVGLINEVVPPDQLMPAAERWANDILAGAPINVRATKESAIRGMQFPVELAMQFNYDWLQRFMVSEDRIEGPTAFAEKRKPQWKSR